MRRIQIIFFILLVANHLSAQNFLPEVIRTDTSKPMIIRLNYGLSYHSQNLPNSFMNYFIQGGKISNDEKGEVSDGLKSSNSLGGEQIITARYMDFSSHPFKDKNWGFFINLEHHNHFGAVFSKNLFDLAFYGNGPYTGQHLDISGFEVNQLSFQKLGVGIADSRSGSEVSVSVVKGQQFSYGNFTKADFYTDDSTANITFEYSSTIARSNPDEKKFSAFNGAGVGVDFIWNFKVLRDTILPTFTRWQLRVMNAGFITWNSATQVHQKDSVVNYTGFEITSFFQPQEDLIGGNTTFQDTITPRYENKKFYSLLPVDVRLGNLVDPYTGKWIKPVFGFRYKLITGFKPMGYAGCIMRLNQSTNFQTIASYGGFGGLRVGIKLQGKFGKNFNYMIGSSSVDGLASSSRYGKDAYIGFWMRF